MKYLTEQMEKVQRVGAEKNKIREAVMDIMEVKLQQQGRWTDGGRGGGAATDKTTDEIVDDFTQQTTEVASDL